MGLCAGLPEESSTGFELCGKSLLGLKENYWQPRGLNSRRYFLVPSRSFVPYFVTDGHWSQTTDSFYCSSER